MYCVQCVCVSLSHLTFESFIPHAVYPALLSHTVNPLNTDASPIPFFPLKLFISGTLYRRDVLTSVFWDLPIVSAARAFSFFGGGGAV